MTILPLKDVIIKSRPMDGKIYFTVQDIENFAEWPEGPLVEIIKGDLYLVPSPSIKHQEISLEIAFQIKQYLINNSIGKIFSAPVDVIFSEEDLFIPDLVFILKSNFGIIKEKNIIGVPDVIIEIVSSNKNRDYVKKKEIYEKYRLPEYWIVDPEENFILIFQINEENKYNNPVTFNMNDEVNIGLLSNIKLKINL